MSHENPPDLEMRGNSFEPHPDVPGIGPHWPRMEVFHAGRHGVSVTISLNMARRADRRCVIQAVSSAGTPFQDALRDIMKTHGRRSLKRNWTSQTVMMHFGEPDDRCVVAMCPVLLAVVPGNGREEYLLLKSTAQAEVALLFAILDRIVEQGTFKTSETTI